MLLINAKCFSFSLGVSILELACNIEVPNGGEGWQQLRQGCLPSQLTSGKVYTKSCDIVPQSLFKMTYLLYLFPGLSAELQTVLRMMLAPEPSDRPTVSELLALPPVRKHKWKRRISLMLTEIMLTFASLCQVMCLINFNDNLNNSLYFFLNIGY